MLSDCGLIPESYGHDSSEEKVYAKAMDILIADALSRLGYATTVFAERSDSADVHAKWMAKPVHDAVFDAKAFRLSRTALNPKDYKIDALNSWRKGAAHACLVGPTIGFPVGDSRLYVEATTYNVALLTYSHLRFALERGLRGGQGLLPVLTVAARVVSQSGSRPTAVDYWTCLDEAFCECLSVRKEDWNSQRGRYFSAVLEAADLQIEYYEGIKQAMERLSKSELVSALISSSKIDQRIATIKQKKQNAVRMLKEIEEAED